MANNYSVTIHIAGAGTKLKNGGESAFGHMWYELDRGDGSKPASYGFAPKEEYHGNPFAPEKVYEDDSDNYDPSHYTKRIEITEIQFNAIRDGNGSIDSGRELFGVDTLKANDQLAADGFDALREFDTNGNGQVEATGSAFASLALWRDLNQDGISQAHELTSLTGNGIASMGIDANGSAQALTDGNLISAMGQFTRTNGTVGTTGEVNGAINNAVANLDLLQNTFYSQYTTAVPIDNIASMNSVEVVNDFLFQKAA